MKRLTLDGLTLADPTIMTLDINEECIIIAMLKNSRAEIGPGDVVHFFGSDREGRAIEGVGMVRVFELNSDSAVTRVNFLIVVDIGVNKV